MSPNAAGSAATRPDLPDGSRILQTHHYWGHDPKHRNTLSKNIRAQSAELLTKHLAAAMDLQALVRREYWNIRQPRFIAIRELFYKISVEVRNYSDLIGVAS